MVGHGIVARCAGGERAYAPAAEEFGRGKEPGHARRAVGRGDPGQQGMTGVGGENATGFLDPVKRQRVEIGRAHVCTPVTNAHLVCRLLLEKKKKLKRIRKTISDQPQLTIALHVRNYSYYS